MDFLTVLFAATALLVLFDLAALAFGAETRDGFVDRPVASAGTAR